MRRREFLRAGAVVAGGYALGVSRVLPAEAGLLDRGDVTLVRGSIRLASHTVSAGHTLRFDPAKNVTLEMRGNLVVRGTLEMKPNPGVRHILRFVGIDEKHFVGGGMNVLNSDVGLWVMGSGKLDIRGDPRAGWNRTGHDTTWKSGDEILTTPFEPGDFTTFARYQGATGGSSAGLATVTSPDSRVFTQEAFDLTRSVRIEGTPRGRTHIFIRSSAPQSIKYAAIRYMGPRQGALPDGNHFVLGRYGLHFHMCGDGSRGSQVVGTVVRDCGSHAFVPHMSNGISFTDCVAYDVNEDAYWWDAPDRSNDVHYQHCMAAKLVPLPSFRGYTLTGFNLGLGSGLVANDCVVAGNQGNTSASGFEWPENTNSDSDLVWTMTNCTAHNNKWAGIFIWQNDQAPHTVSDFSSFRNNIGIEHGAYGNLYHVDRLLTFDNGTGLVMHALSMGAPPQDQLAYSNVSIFDGISVVKHQSPFDGIATFYGSVVSHVSINERGGGAGRYDFVECMNRGNAALESVDFSVRYMQSNSIYRVQRTDGTAYRLNPDGTTTPIPAFA